MITLYLSGEIHSQWRDELASTLQQLNIEAKLLSPVTDHQASDDCGTDILGDEPTAYWKDRKGAGINSIRTRLFIEQADIVIVRFGEKYRQWNAAFDAGLASAMGKPLITLHPESLDHALKEVDAAAQATARTPEQVAQIIEYIMK